MVARDLQIGDDQVVLQRTTDPHHPAGGQLVEGGRAAVALGGRGAGRAGGTGAGAALREVALRGLGLRLLVRLGGLLLLMGRLLLRDERLLLMRALGLLPALGLRLRLPLGRLAALLRPAAGAGLLLRLLGGGLLTLVGLLALLGHAHRRLPAVRARGTHRGGTAAGNAEPGAVGGITEMDGRTRADFHLLDSLALHIGAVGGTLILNDPTAPAPAHRGMSPGDPGVVQHHVALRVTPQAVRPGWIKCPGLSVQFQYEFRHSMPH
ncbi:hypothetical protein SVIO_031980 [Streptomyces violaceusniger]|uniref:Uncharacterized protein n=1 Tax=Streptomyces violaceusniger TaxID=68280 RepID=A0A4D4KUE5_STRVO|nr:hypothetical protein SVIO_031980 [Streptomyces violaceusniger]